MKFEYETLRGTKQKKSLLVISDFKPEESNRIILGLVQKIEQYEQKRKLTTDYERIMTDKGERIVKAEMKSRDKVIDCTITYNQPDYFMLETNAEINAKLDFKSKNESLKKEYMGLANILKKCESEKMDKNNMSYNTPIISGKPYHRIFNLSEKAIKELDEVHCSGKPYYRIFNDNLAEKTLVYEQQKEQKKAEQKIERKTKSMLEGFFGVCYDYIELTDEQRKEKISQKDEQRMINLGAICRH